MNQLVSNPLAQSMAWRPARASNAIVLAVIIAHVSLLVFFQWSLSHHAALLRALPAPIIARMFASETKPQEVPEKTRLPAALPKTVLKKRIEPIKKIESATTDSLPAQSEPISKVPGQGGGNEQSSGQSDSGAENTASNSNPNAIVDPNLANKTSQVDSALVPAVQAPVKADTDAVAFPMQLAVQLPKLPQAVKMAAYNGDFSKGGLSANGFYQIEKTQTGYRSRLAIEPVGFNRFIYGGDYIWSSEGVFVNQGLVPKLFSDKRGKRAERILEFDAAQNQVKTGEFQMAMPLGTQDRVSLIWQLGAMARADSAAFLKGLEFSVPLAASRSVPVSRWRAVGEKIELPAGLVNSIHFVRQDQGDQDMRFEIWLDADADFIPARIKLTNAQGLSVDLVKVAEK
jgi:hypothetical protein